MLVLFSHFGYNEINTHTYLYLTWNYTATAYICDVSKHDSQWRSHSHPTAVQWRI